MPQRGGPPLAAPAWVPSRSRASEQGLHVVRTGPVAALRFATLTIEACSRRKLYCRVMLP